MSNSKDGIDNGSLLIQEAYANVYNEIVQPDKVFVATQYFRQKWVPLLGPTLAWIIIALRQHCYWNRQTGELRNWCLVTQEELAKEVGVTEATVRRLLRHEYAGRFIIDVSHRYRYDAGLGKQIRKQSMYQVRMDDPLVPEDETRLREQVAERLGGLRCNPETGQIDALSLLDQFSSMAVEDLASAEGGHSAVKMIDRSNGPERNGQSAVGTEPSSAGEAEAPLPYPDAIVVLPGQLSSFELAEDYVLVEWKDGYLSVPLAEVIKRDIRHGADLVGQTHRTKCYYSVSHALGEGGDNWLPEEERRLELESQLVSELISQYRHLGAFSLEEALSRYFSAQLMETLLQDRSEHDLQRIEEWVAYVRKNDNLKNPAGFLRTRIESKEYPPGV